MRGDVMRPETIAGFRIPDSKLAREATELLREHGTELLFAHSLRVYLFGAIRGRHRGLTFDQESLYFGAVFHDLGLTAKYRSQDHRFEIDSANAALFVGGLALWGHYAARQNAIPSPSRGSRDAIAEAQTPQEVPRERPEQKRTAHDLSDIFAPSKAAPASEAYAGPRIGEQPNPPHPTSSLQRARINSV
jgi:hypothetical protein